MAKDPAFLFYPGDWMGGVSTFTRAHKGAYMDVLMAQHNNGHLSIEDIEIVLGSDFESMCLYYQSRQTIGQFLVPFEM